jgi:hypothetical protein
VEDLDLFEVSIIDDTMSPCYTGTLIEQRANEEVITEQRGGEFKAVTVDNTDQKANKTVDYTEYENRINKIKKVEGE